MSAIAPTDHAVREEALDVAESFIVRAPAGSGKTRLLIQRYLALLATVNAPEEVVAVTFTRKAAAEMRERVLGALQDAQSQRDQPSQEVTTLLALDVLRRSAEFQWQLETEPARLRIQTIDSLNAMITRQMPIASQFGAQPESLDDAGPLYGEAARATLALIDSTHPAGADVAILLSHLDNDVSRAESLVADMLASREKWLRHLHGSDNRTALEAAMKRVRRRAMAKAAQNFPVAEREETLELVRFSRPLRPESLARSGVWREALPESWPSDSEDALVYWQMIATLLLTDSGDLRKPAGINARSGFPIGETPAQKAEYGAWKTRMKELLDRISLLPARVVESLAELRGLPDSAYRDADWRVLNAITALLPVATAILWHTFAQRGQCDFAEISQSALRALGPDDGPTDLALALDYRIRHLLIDEFQDTSIAQFELLEKLVRGWTPGDGRTFFAVGDPMQSIYRFRSAEVGLYLRAMRNGVGGVPLKPLGLKVNFRSSNQVIDWVNQTFARILPDVSHDDLNKVPFAASQACIGASSAGRVAVHAQIFRGVQGAATPAEALEDEEMSQGTEEATLVVRLVLEALAEESAGRVAILVRSRTHLAEIVPALKCTGIAFKAVDLDPLGARSVVLDLVALVRAILHPADRASWLALLRAPWVALTSAELAMLVAGDRAADGELAPDPRSIWEILNDSERTGQLAPQVQTRLAWFCKQVTVVRECVHRTPLRNWLEPLWLSLLGPACLDDKSSPEDAALALNVIEEEAQRQTGGYSIEDFSLLDRAIERLYANSSEEARVELMTIHKSKGLEFDTVILPGLHRRTRGDPRRLMVWHEEPDHQTGVPQLLMAPIREAGGDDGDDATYRYVQALEKERRREEDVRLLYVAATRARRTLHLIGAVHCKNLDGAESAAEPSQDSLLGILWPAVAKHFDCAQTAMVAATPAVTRRDVQIDHPLRRLSPDASLPVFESACPSAPANITAIPSGRAEFEWAGETARHTGSVVHLWLQRIAEDGLAQWPLSRLPSESQRIARALLERGVAESEVAAAGERTMVALMRTLSDPRGQWILGLHDHARSEWRLSGVRAGRIVHYAIDRSFVDLSGTRWIIDFKSGTHEGGDLEAFLDNERERYRAQLEGYAALVSSLEPSGGNPHWPIMLGLYFPAMGGWREWRWSAP